MLHMLRTFRCSKLDASVSQRGYLHSRYRIFLKDRDGILADDALFGVGMRSLRRERSVLVLQLEGSSLWRGPSGSFDLPEGGVAGVLRSQGYGCRQEGRQRNLLIEWEPGLLGTRQIDPTGPVRLSIRTARRLREMAAELDAIGADEVRAAPVIASILALLRAEGLPFDSIEAGDLHEAVPEQRILLSRSVDALLSSGDGLPGLVDLESTLPWTRRTIHRLLSEFQETYAFHMTGGWRRLLHWWRIPLAAALMSSPKATTEEVAALLGYSSHRALCNAFANAGLPPPGAIRETLANLS